MQKIRVLHKSVITEKTGNKIFPWRARCNYYVDGKWFEVVVEDFTKTDAMLTAVNEAWKEAIKKAN